MPIYELLEDIFKQIDSISKWQHDFIRALFVAVFTARGRVNFTNLSRFSPLGEQRFRRNFNKPFDWFRFNRELTTISFADKKEALILAIDCTFLPKNGNKTWGLDRFWSGVAGRAQRGLEASVAALIHTGHGTSSHLAPPTNHVGPFRGYRCRQRQPDGLLMGKADNWTFDRVCHHSL
jgi:hypothetical protein